MTLKTQLSSILNQEMNRQEFLKTLAIGLVAISGASTALKLLAQKQSTDFAAAQTYGNAYGSSAYGGADSGKR